MVIAIGILRVPAVVFETTRVVPYIAGFAVVGAVKLISTVDVLIAGTNTLLGRENVEDARLLIPSRSVIPSSAKLKLTGYYCY
jgi:hypothetical protein